MAKASKATAATKVTRSSPHAAVELRELELHALRDSPSNPRKTYDQDKLDELAASIGADGVLEPIMVRPAEGYDEPTWQVVFGSRRVRACRIAGLATIPALIRTDLSDAQALELQIAENNQRQDVEPLDEADAIRELVETHGRDVHDVAARLGRSLPWVRARLALADATGEVRDLLSAGTIGEGAAALLCRLEPDAQREVAKDLRNRADYRAPDGRWTTHSVRSLLQSRTHRVKLAPWALDDNTLPGGPCTTCPKRSSVQASLFGDLDADDLCLDRGCWNTKRDAAITNTLMKARIAGLTVVEGEEAEALAPHGEVKWGSDIVDLDELAPDDLGANRDVVLGGDEDTTDDDWSEKTWREVLGDKVEATQLIVVDGKVIPIAARSSSAAFSRFSRWALSPPPQRTTRSITRSCGVHSRRRSSSTAPRMTSSPCASAAASSTRARRARRSSRGRRMRCAPPATRWTSTSSAAWSSSSPPRTSSARTRRRSRRRSRRPTPPSCCARSAST